MNLKIALLLATNAFSTAANSQGVLDPMRSAGGSPATSIQGSSLGGGTPTITNLTPARPATAQSPVPATPAAGSGPSTPVPTDAARSEFQEFLRQSSGIDLPMFGAELFRGVPSTFAPVENVPVTPDYLIGPGDEIVIRTWGTVDIDFRAVVDRSGTINIPKVGVLNVSGIPYQSLGEYLKTAIGRVFRNFEITANLGQLRSIQVYVVGQARRPGSYTVSSLSTLLNTVFAAGGASVAGSMRGIQLKRGNQTVTELDLYDLLIRGDKSKDAKLLPGDVIYFPPVGAVVAVTGGVNVPAIFELKREETLADLLGYAGGLTTTAASRNASVERIENRTIRRVDEFSLDPTGLARSMRDGDVVTVFSISPRFENAVLLRGTVAHTVRLVWKPNMRVRDVIPEPAALLSRDYWVSRTRPAGTVSLGEFRPPVGEINWEYAVIERINRADYSTSLIPFHLGKAVIDADPSQNLVLTAGDIITVFSKNDVRIPIASQTKYIRLEGEFLHSGVYQVMPGETLRQIIQRAGGLTPNAYLFGAEFSRESTRKLQQEKLEEATNRLDRDLQRVAASRSQNTITPEDAQNLKPQLEAQQALIAKLRAVRATGRIVIEIPPDARQTRDIPDIALEDGDRFLVPPPPSTVGVFGAVYNENSFMFKAEKRVDDYLSQAGGATRDADESSLYVLRADGSVVSRRQGSVFAGLGSGIGGLRPMPGDTIVVPEQLDKTEFRRVLRDWTQIFAQFGLGVAALKVFKGL